MKTTKLLIPRLLFGLMIISSLLSYGDQPELPELTSIRYDETGFAKIIDKAIEHYFPEYQDPDFVPPDNFLTKDSIRTLTLNMDSHWLVAAVELNYTWDEIEEIQQQARQNTFISTANPDVQKLIKQKKLILAENKAVFDQILLFLSSANQRFTAAGIIESLSYYDSIWNSNWSGVLRSHQKNKSIPEKRVSNKASTYSSYIFTLWLKHPTRSADWGHVVPNTALMPHQQTVYDWARLNPDKLVILWYDSTELSGDEIQQFRTLSGQMSLYLGNIRFLDVRDVVWSPVKLNYRYQNLGQLTPEQALNRIPFPHLGDKADFLRTRLLYEGSSAIRSALKPLKLQGSSKETLPQTGFYFDLDYIPRPYNARQLVRNELCIDNSFHILEKTFVYGRAVFNSTFFISLLAVRTDRSRLLGPELRINDTNQKELISYGDTLKTVEMSRYNICGISGFTMRVNPYTHQKQFEGMSKTTKSWDTDYDRDIDRLHNLPLNPW